MTDSVRVLVDATVCALSGYCEKVAGDFFELGEDGLVFPAEAVQDPEVVARLLDAETVCPTGALHVRSGQSRALTD